jgi:hypothetical protein
MVFFAMTALWRPSWAVESRHELRIDPATGESTSYRAVLEAQGSLHWKGAQNDERSAPLHLQGEVVYVERLLDVRATDEGQDIDAVRFYRKAEVSFRIGDQSRTNQLSEDRRLLTARLSDQRLVIAAPLEPLTRDELDLVDIPGCSLALHLLLPTEPVAVGDRWPVSSAALTPLLGLSLVESSQVQGQMLRVENGVAVLEFRGEVAGKADGSRTRIQLEAKANLDLKARTLTWFTATIREQRDISDTQPGLNVTARLRLVAEKHSEPPAELADAALPAELQPAAVVELVRLISQLGGFELLCDRHWRVIVDRRDVLIARLFEDEQLIGQLVITALPDGPPGKHLALPTLQADVVQSISPHAGQIVETAEGTGDGGLRVLRVSAAGVVSEVSMQWVYYHVSNDAGRRAGLTFTFQTDLLEKFADRDRGMVETFQFRPRADTGQPASTEAAEPSQETPAATGAAAIQTIQ